MTFRPKVVTAGMACLSMAALGLSACDSGRNGRDPTTPSGFEVPRYLTLRYDTVNARSGPSEDHRTLWTYHARGLPVQIVAETEQWRRICDPEGGLSWVHMRLLDGRRSVIRTAEGAVIVRKTANEASAGVATLKPKVIAPLDGDCANGWCKVELGKVKGYVAESAVWGTNPAPQCRARVAKQP